MRACVCACVCVRVCVCLSVSFRQSVTVHASLPWKRRKRRRQLLPQCLSPDKLFCLPLHFLRWSLTSIPNHFSNTQPFGLGHLDSNSSHVLSFLFLLSPLSLNTHAHAHARTRTLTRTHTHTLTHVHEHLHAHTHTAPPPSPVLEQCGRSHDSEWPF